MVLNGIVNFGRNDHKAATQDNFRPLIMAFRLLEGKFAFCKDQIQAIGKVFGRLNIVRTFFDELQVRAESADTLETKSYCSNGNAVAFKAFGKICVFLEQRRDVSRGFI